MNDDLANPGHKAHLLSWGNMPSQGVRHQAVAWGGLSHYIYGPSPWGLPIASHCIPSQCCKHVAPCCPMLLPCCSCCPQEWMKFKAWISPLASIWQNGTLKPHLRSSTERRGVCWSACGHVCIHQKYSNGNVDETAQECTVNRCKIVYKCVKIIAASNSQQHNINSWRRQRTRVFCCFKTALDGAVGSALGFSQWTVILQPWIMIQQAATSDIKYDNTAHVSIASSSGAFSTNSDLGPIFRMETWNERRRETHKSRLAVIEQELAAAYGGYLRFRLRSQYGNFYELKLGLSLRTGKTYELSISFNIQPHLIDS